MAKKYIVQISDGQGTENISNGNYDVSVSSVGYDSSSINPNNISVTDNVDSYSFTISASGTLILHVTEDGTSGGTPVEGAVFYRCDSSGNKYGNPITTGADGNATFNNIPYAASDAPNIYYVQTETSESHNFDSTLQTIQVLAQQYTKEISNPLAKEKTIILTDQYYSNLPVTLATITLDES